MKQLIRLGIIFNILACSSAFATDPVQGFYFGAFGEISHASAPKFSGEFLGYTVNQGNLSIEPVGAGGGLSLGYKIDNFRLEGELLYNVNPYRTLQVGSCTLVSPNIVSPQASVACALSNPDLYLSDLGFKGGTTDYYGMFNAYYDFQFGFPEVSLVPYLGLGVGYSMIKNQAQFQTSQYSDNLIFVSAEINNSKTSPALQGIVGIYYYMDDFATLGMDYRFLTTVNFNKNSTNTLTSNNSSSYGIHTLNFVVNFVLGKGSNE